MNSSFFPLDTMELEQDADMDVTASERRVSRIIYEYWKLPLSVSPPAGVNNLYPSHLSPSSLPYHSIILTRMSERTLTWYLVSKYP